MVFFDLVVVCLFVVCCLLSLSLFVVGVGVVFTIVLYLHFSYIFGS